jgi:ectoine hydroxylase-related dioxygenase (phytanoyl-CoA dioxygenase family)
MRTYQTEHPYSGNVGQYWEQLKAAGWVDYSWHNDACPRFFHPERQINLWIEYEDLEKRESGAPRFVVVRELPDEYPDPDFMSEEWGEAAAYLKRLGVL